MVGPFLYPSDAAIRHALESRLPSEAWKGVTETEVGAITTIVRARSRKTIEVALAEFTELITNAYMSKRSPTGKRGGRPPETERDALLVRMMQEPTATYQSVADAYNRLYPPPPGKTGLSKEAVRKVAKRRS